MKNRNEEDREICELIQKMHEREMSELLAEFEGVEKHVFSEGFEQKKAQLFARMEKKIRRREWGRYTAAAAAVLFILWSVSHPQYYVEAARKIMEWFEENVVFQFTEKNLESDIEAYTLEYVPEGYELAKQFYDNKHGVMVYEYNGNTIEFYYAKGSSQVFVNGENIALEEIPVGRSADIYNLESDSGEYQSSLIWKSEDGEMVFYISGDVSDEELLEMYESMEEIKQ